jgi:hypothetical protein
MLPIQNLAEVWRQLDDADTDTDGPQIQFQHLHNQKPWEAMTMVCEWMASLLAVEDLCMPPDSNQDLHLCLQALKRRQQSLQLVDPTVDPSANSWKRILLITVHHNLFIANEYCAADLMESSAQSLCDLVLNSQRGSLLQVPHIVPGHN